ncbi:Alpha/Beta hydrolase protein [Polychytrium aggregatum]|uniref:Alpha/Beta hydrolase protein n=1 Tax=Polychytrium aggregatum TaxID=110093 RepID=UPI0022FE557C|nr:Alpha/Beta hydrolase protein [Polychytrium aggregatum]KAI9207817.1 Alpha/Beta hydrolase protein [Polychytrium aggregatum]
MPSPTEKDPEAVSRDAAIVPPPSTQPSPPSTCRPFPLPCSSMTSREAPPPPKLTSLVQKLSHSLPFVVHLLLVSVAVLSNSLLALAVHLVDGPLHHNWSLVTTLTHAIVKTTMFMNPPQGFHSIRFVRQTEAIVEGIKAISRYLPVWFTGTHTIADAEIVIHNAGAFSKFVRDVITEGTSKTTPIEDPLLRTSRSVRGEWISRKDLDFAGQDPAVESTTAPLSPASPVILFVHGGAHYFLSPTSYRPLTTFLCDSRNASVFALDYRKSPTFIFPSGLEDVLAAYLAMFPPPALLSTDSTLQDSCSVEFVSASDSGNAILDQTCRGVHKHHNKPFYMVGDSSGGGLILQALAVIKALDWKMPDRVVLLSPFVDTGLESKSWYRNQLSDYMTLDSAGIDWAMRCYRGEVPLSNRFLSPLLESYKGYGLKILIQAGDSEVLTDDAMRLYQQIVQTSGDETTCRLELYHGMFHVFQCLGHVASSATEALKRVEEFLNESDDDVDTDVEVDLDNEDEQTIYTEHSTSSPSKSMVYLTVETNGSVAESTISVS